MREILFRGKQLDNGKWIEGSLMDCRPHYKWQWILYLAEGEDGMMTCYKEEVDPDTVGQYTGLMVKGKRIFEGDILSGLFIFGMRVAGVVEFRDGSFGVKWMRGTNEEFSAFTSCCNIEWEVIGNIHDDPELLEGKDGK